ncbi:MAG: four helix bundle protein [Verrucomicrobia bacterium]|jgi:four helix bundle protein|nr:four helix bundle protein [Verrucomicrobiota bacterium]MBT7067429.1 four helix bundle protein [Verrucomicrobiota bacterium]MBT7701216.1 four helix bundle protein [Verrucomicrobiota bacterium]
MEQLFPHEKLEVYGVAVSFAAGAGELLASWPTQWAVHDQFDRATESVVTNLTKSARLRATERGVYCLECSLGSVLECAACLDVAFRRRLVDSAQVESAKKLLQQIARMEVGLRRSWDHCVKEDRGPYGETEETYFLHESLDVYRRSLQIHESLGELWHGGKISRYTRRIDELTTSLTLNIAEGNGRFSSLDHRKFLGTAEEAGTKLAAYLDLVEATATIEVDDSRSYLRRVMAMLAGLKGYLEE